MTRTDQLPYLTLEQLNDLLDQRDREIIRSVDKLNVLSGAQIRRLHFEGEGNSRTDNQRARRALLRLTRLGVLARLERRIGGKKLGSDGFCYRLGPSGQRLLRLWSGQPVSRGRNRPEPGERFIRHRLAVSELYVRLMEAARQSDHDEVAVLEFQAEPDAWRPYEKAGATSRLLKPDAFTRVGVGDLEHWWFCELDLGTISRKARESQAAAYRAYWRSRAAGDVMPRVLWITTNQLVSDLVRAAVKSSGEPGGLFVVATLDDAIALATVSADDGTRR